MTIEIKYDQNRELLHISVQGTPDFDEFASIFETITNSNDYPPNIRAIWDFRNSDISSVNSEMLKHLIEIRKRFEKRNTCRSALIVSSNMQYGMGRMFQMLSEGKIPHEFMVFRDYEECEQWLLKNDSN